MLISKIDWGNDSAEKDPYLLEYFIDHTALIRLQNCSKSLIVGRKGAGKSAIRTRLIEYFEQNGYHVVTTSPSYNMINSIIMDKDITNNFDEEIFFQYVWLKHLLKSALIKIGDQKYCGYCSESYKYARELALAQGQTTRELLESVRELLNRVKIKAGKLGDLGINIESVLREESDVGTYTFHLGELSKSENVKVIFIIDDLDLGWNNSKTANNLLLGLLTTISSLKGISHNFHPFICIREDVYRILLMQTQHSDKFRDIETIRWTSDDLKSLLEERIRFNYKKLGVDIKEDLFYSVFPASIGSSSTDNWLVERTLGRPRELLQLVRLYSENNYTDNPDSEILKNAEETYSNWKLDDLCTEYKYQYPGLDKIFSYWKAKFFRHKYHLKKDEINEIILDIFIEAECNEKWFEQLKNDTDVPRFLETLYRIGFIGDFILGGQGGSKVVYSVNELHRPVFDEVQIHPCFRKALGTVERIRNK